MKLKAYLKETGQTLAAFAAKVGYSEATVSRWASGKRTPNMSATRVIAKASNNAVLANDFMGDQDG